MAQEKTGLISGKVLSMDGEPVDYANVFLKGTHYSCYTDDKGLYHLNACVGKYTLVVSSVGYDKVETPVEIKLNEITKVNVKLKSAGQLA